MIKRNVLVAVAVGVVMGWIAGGMGSSAQSPLFPIPTHTLSSPSGCHWEIVEAGGAAMLLNQCDGETWFYVDGAWRAIRR